MNKTEIFKRFGLMIIGILIFQVSFSQENYISGYVIKNNNDTLFGYVNYKNWDKNPDIIMFKTDPEKNPISYKSTDIIEFSVQNEIYVSGIINTEVSSTQAGRLENGSQMKIKVDTTFLQTLIRGKKSLYYYKNRDGRENFYIKQDTGFELLYYKRYLKHKDGKQIIIENKRYIGQLAVYLNDCKTIQSKLKYISYNQKSLIKLFQYYHKHSQSEIYFQKETRKINTEFGILAGASLSSLEFRSSDFAYLVNAGYNPSINYSHGLFVDFILPRQQGKWSIYNELLFTTYDVNGRYVKYENEDSYKITTTELGFSYLKINNFVRFKYPISHVFLFLNVGISNGFIVSERNYKKRETKFYTLERVYEGAALNSTRRHEQSYIIGSGVKYNNFSLEFRFEKGNGMSAYITLNSITKRYYCLFGYKF